MKGEEKAARTLGRLLAALARRGAAAHGFADGGRVEVVREGASVPDFVGPAEAVEAGLRLGLLRRDARGEPALSDAGAAYLRRQRHPDEPYRGQHLELHRPSGGAQTAPLMDAAESPLAWLRRRKGAGGAAFVTETQFQAGERLRSDYTRAGLVPRLGIDPTRLSVPRGPKGTGNRVADTVDSAVAARQRVNAALRALGPELGSVLVDICCELVGLEEVERRRQWPRRSGKVVLGIALDRLARHYGLAEEAQGRTRAPGIRSWGAEDYRPRLDGTDAR